ncbi:hypothetical protein PV327_011481, partial [Microctonus hyperodae]
MTLTSIDETNNIIGQLSALSRCKYNLCIKSGKDVRVVILLGSECHKLIAANSVIPPNIIKISSNINIYYLCVRREPLKLQELYATQDPNVLFLKKRGISTTLNM